jgi:mono/diheme cytochrome c family protein
MNTARLARGFASRVGKRTINQLMKKIIFTTAILALLATPTLRAEEGKAIYEKDCTNCHGADGKGQTKMGQKLGAKDYSDPKVQAALTDDAAFKAIKEGFKNKEDKVLMKPTEGVSDAEIKAVVAYLRTFKK